MVVTQSNLEIFKSIIERGFSRGDLSVADEVCAERLVEHEYLSKTDVPGLEILKSQIEDARRSIKDLKLTLEAFVETQDTVWARCRAAGTDPRSGKSLSASTWWTFVVSATGSLLNIGVSQIASRCCTKSEHFRPHRSS